MNIDKFVSHYQNRINRGMGLAEAVASFQRQLLLQAFKDSRTFTQVTEMLSLKRPNVYQLIERLNISEECLKFRDGNRAIFAKIP